MESYREHKLQRICLHFKAPLLSMRTVVIKLHIGRCLGKEHPTYEDEANVFEVLDAQGACVDEVWTTLKFAKRKAREGLRFFTTFWGLSLNYAKITKPESRDGLWTPRGCPNPKLL